MSKPHYQSQQFQVQAQAALESIYARILRLNITQFTLCSTQHQAGNSLLALAIAQRAAESGKRVLLIELNRTTPSLAKQHAAQTQNQAREWLPLTGHWEHAAQESSQAGLMLLCCPDKSSHCVEFRDQETLKLFFTSCAQQFDMVICDVEPILFSAQELDRELDGEAQGLPVDVICAASKATLLNVVTSRTTESQIDEARDILLQSGASLQGVIMNDCYAPSLKQELIRETYRLQRLFPKWMSKLRKRLDSMILLNQEL